MAGRPTKRTQERVDKVLEALRCGNTRKAACACAGISEDTLANWIANTSDFSDAVKKAEAEAEAEMVDIVRQAARDTWTAAAWWLERRNSAEWGKKDKVDVTSKDEKVQVAIYIPHNGRNEAEDQTD